MIVGSGGGSLEFTEEQYRLYYSGQAEALQRVHDPDFDHRHAGQRDLHAVRLSGDEPHRLDGMHLFDRCDRLCLPQHSGGGSGHDGGGRCGRADRAVDPARIRADADHEHALELRSRSALRGLFRATATAS